MIGPVAAILLAVAAPSASVPQDVRQVGGWSLLDNPDSCMIQYVEDGETLQVAALDGNPLSMMIFESPGTRGLAADSPYSVELTIDGTGGVLSGSTMTINGQNRLVIGATGRVMINILRPARSVSGRVDGAQMFDFTLPTDSGAAYDAFMACYERLSGVN